MLRHAIFVLVLVGAAFAGGAAINGPGLAWLQHNLIGGPTIIVDGSTPAGTAARPGKRLPAANPPPLFVDFNAKLPRPKSQSAGLTSSDPTISLPAESPASPAARLLQLPEPAGTDLAATAARPASSSDQAPAQFPAAMTGYPSLAAPLDSPADAVASASAPASDPAEASRTIKADPIARLASTTGGLDPASSPAPSGSSRDWTEVRQRLKALGVSRYTINAETDGRVRFSCVIPMDGLRAVGHHFEAEGDDEFQAIDATIRRVTLWRATEPGRTDP